MHEALGELRATGGAVVSVFRDRNLRLMEVARFSALLANAGSSIVFIVVVYDLGGAGGVAALAVVRLVVTAVAAPFGSLFGDRYERRKVIVAADTARVLNFLGAAGAMAWTSSLTLTIALAALTTVIGTVSSPARVALLPMLAPTPERLTAANTSDTIGTFAGPALAGVALAISTPARTFVAAAALAALAPVVVSRIRPPELGSPTEIASRERRVRRALVAGFRALWGVPSVRALVFLYGVVSFVAGAMTILFAVTAIRLLDLGASGVGFLYSFFIAGAIAGSVLSVLLIRRSLETGIVAGAIAWGLPLAAIGLWPRPEVAYVLFVIGGAGDTVASVASVTLLQRVIPDEVLSRSLGALGFVLTAVGVVGSLVAPLVVGGIGVRGALLLFGAVVLGGIIPAGLFDLRQDDIRLPPGLYLRADEFIRGGGLLAGDPARLDGLATWRERPLLRRRTRQCRALGERQGDCDGSRRGMLRRDRAPARHPAHGNRDGTRGRRAVCVGPACCPCGADGAHTGPRERGGTRVAATRGCRVIGMGRRT